MRTTKTVGCALIALLVVGGSHWAWSQSTIAYTGGPAFQIPVGFTPASLDLDREGAADFSFVGRFPICTMDIPCSYCEWPFYVASAGTNELQSTPGGYASILSDGEWIGTLTASNSFWSRAAPAILLAWWWSQRAGTSGSLGPLATLGSGYLGVRFAAADGPHYGWIQVRLPQPSTNGLPSEVTPVVTDWAYETRVGVPIRAGARPVPVPLTSPHIARAGYVRLTAATEIGKAYQVQAKARLDAFPWSNLSFVIPATTTNTMVDLPMAAPAQFFRVVEAD